MSEYREKCEAHWNKFRETHGDKHGTYSAADLLAWPELQPEDGDTWGHWRFTKTEPWSLDFIGLHYAPPFAPYEVVLARIHDDRSLLNWIGHIATKDFEVGNFVEALWDLTGHAKEWGAEQNYWHTIQKAQTCKK
jgi:hypothetical protein